MQAFQIDHNQLFHLKDKVIKIYLSPRYKIKAILIKFKISIAQKLIELSLTIILH